MYKYDEGKENSEVKTLGSGILKQQEVGRLKAVPEIRAQRKKAKLLMLKMRKAVMVMKMVQQNNVNMKKAKLMS